MANNEYKEFCMIYTNVISDFFTSVRQVYEKQYARLWTFYEPVFAEPLVQRQLLGLLLLREDSFLRRRESLIQAGPITSEILLCKSR